MLTPLSELTAKIYLPIDFISTDRLAISLPDKDHTKFSVNIYGATISQEEYRTNYKGIYATHTEHVKDADGNVQIKMHYFARASRTAAHDFPLRIPERKRIEEDYSKNFRGERWEFAATDITACIIYKLWIENNPYTEDRIHFTEDAKALFDYLLITSARMSENAKIAADYKNTRAELDAYKAEHNGSADPEVISQLEGKLIPANDLQFCATKPLAPYQQVINYLQVNSEGYANFSEQGTGKTPVNIATIDNLALDNYEKTGKILKVLVVCPNNVRSNWENEFHNFSTVDGRVTILRGTEQNRIKCYVEAFCNITDEKYSVIICGYDIIHRFDALTNLKWDVVITDESHYYKDPSTKRWSEGISKIRDNSKRRYISTGTPVCNSIVDIWSQLEFLRKGGSGFISFKNFKDFYCVYDDFSTRVGYQNLPFIKERLAQSSFKITKKEAMPDLPEKVYDIVEVEMTSHQQLVYDKIATELQYKIERELEAAGGHMDAMTVTNILTQMLRLAQITSGFITYDAVYDNDGTVIKPKIIERFNEQPKLNAIIEALQERQERNEKEKTLIWACFKSDLIALQEAIEAHGFKTVLFYGETTEQQRIEREYLFNYDDSYTVFIGNAAAGGTGLNLLGYPPQKPELSEYDVTEEYFYSQNWSAVCRAQSEDRAHRRGTRRTVRIRDFQVPNTIDVQIRQRVVEKREDAANVQDIQEIFASFKRNLLNR